MDLPVKNIVSEIDLTPNDALLPIFETIVNSIVSLKLTKDIPKEEKKIQIKIGRGEYPQSLAFNNNRTISSVMVIDNGEGFTNSNLQSFRTAYSRKNKDLGCKGIGRFTMLAVFEQVNIISNFKEEGNWFQRAIQFDTDNEVKLLSDEPSILQERKTTVELQGCYNTSIKDHTALSIERIAEHIMEHCLVYYLCNDLPRIEILDLENDEAITVNELYSSLSKEREKDFTIREELFKCYITKTPKSNNRKNHYIHYCANSRAVGEGKSIAKVNSIFAWPIIEKGVSHFLDVYVVSEYLNKKVYAARNGFTIPQTNDMSLFNELTFEDIDTFVAKQVESGYDEFVKNAQDRNIKELREYIIKYAPRFNRYLNRLDILEKIPPNLSEDKKEEYLYRIAYTERKSIDAKIQNFIDNKELNEDTIAIIKEELREKTVYDADSLADYMLRRKAIIELFKKFLEADEKGQYKLEEDIHNLIFPMGVTQDNVDYESHNLWLLDERFVNYNFIASDKPITAYSQKKSRKEADIVLLDEIDIPNMFENPISFSADSSGKLSSMVIFEFKRPGQVAHQKNKTDYRWEFSELIEKYFDDFIYTEDKKNYKGRQVILQENTPKFGYVIVDVIPPTLERFNLSKGYKKTPFGTLYKLSPELNLHIEVITFQQLIEAAEKRHAPFFDKLF